MNSPIESRQRVAIYGRVVVEQTEKPLPGVQIRITEYPQEFADLLVLKSVQYGDEWHKMVRWPDRTSTTEDGFFFFADLPIPKGNYTLVASLPGAGFRYGQTKVKVKLSRDPKTNVVASDPSPIVIKLSATSIAGHIIRIIKDENNENKEMPVAMAEVKVLGSGERVYSDKKGRFLLTGIEPRTSGKDKGKRDVQVTTPGYQLYIVQTKTLSKAGAVENLNDIELK